MFHVAGSCVSGGRPTLECFDMSPLERAMLPAATSGMSCLRTAAPTHLLRSGHGPSNERSLRGSHR